MTEHQAKKLKMESNLSDTEKAPEKKSPTTSPSSEADLSETASSSPLSSSKYTRGDQVTLVIGSDEQELVVPGHLLANTSEFFEAALKKEWKEGQTRTVKLPEEDVKTTTLYLDFVCGQGLPTKAIKLYEDMDEEDGEEYLILARLYGFGERVLDKAVRNAVMEEILRMVSLKDDEGRMLLPDDDTISAIYQSTPANSPARRLLVDLHVSYGLPDNLDSDTCDLNRLTNWQIWP